MARPGITYNEVALSAQQLIAAGKNPTIDAIRIQLGTGSNSTLGNHLRTFKERQTQTEQIASKEHLPEVLIATLKGLWEGVIQQPDEKIAAVTQETETAVKDLKEQLLLLSEDNAQLKQSLHALKLEKDSIFHEK